MSCPAKWNKPLAHQCRLLLPATCRVTNECDGRGLRTFVGLSRPLCSRGGHLLSFPTFQSLAKWENNNKIVCEQKLLKGEGPQTSWSRELTNDGELILVRNPPPFFSLGTAVLPRPPAFSAALFSLA